MARSLAIVRASSDILQDDIDLIQRMAVRFGYAPPPLLIDLEKSTSFAGDWLQPIDLAITMGHGDTTHFKGHKRQGDAKIEWYELGRRLEELTLTEESVLIQGCCFSGSYSALANVFAGSDKLGAVIAPQTKTSHNEVLAMITLVFHALADHRVNLRAVVEQRRDALLCPWVYREAEELREAAENIRHARRRQLGLPLAG